MIQTFVLTRMGSTPFGTLGTLITPHSHTYATLEPQWRKNQKGVSCVPSGLYPLKLRQSQVVQRASGNEFSSGFELTEVPKRSLVMIHPGNWQADSNGCILVGRDFGSPGGTVGITKSRDAFKELMNYMLDLQKSDSLEILIKWQSWE